MALAADLVMMERSSLDNFTLGPFTVNSEQYARQLVNLILEWAAFVVHQVLIQLIF